MLVERFLGVDACSERYDERLVELREELIDSGLAAQILDQWATVLTEQAADLVSGDVVTADAASIARYF